MLWDHMEIDCVFTQLLVNLSSNSPSEISGKEIGFTVVSQLYVQVRRLRSSFENFTLILPIPSGNKAFLLILSTELKKSLLGENKHGVAT